LQPDSPNVASTDPEHERLREGNDAELISAICCIALHCRNFIKTIKPLSEELTIE
jgi:hypothetical protein